QYLRILVKFAPYTVAAVLTYNRKSGPFGMLLYGVADITQRIAGLYLLDTQPHAFVGGFGQAAAQDGGFPDIEHAAGVTEPAVLDDGDIDIHDVAVLQDLVSGDAVADHMIDGCADGR